MLVFLYLWYTLFIWYHFLLMRLFLSILCVFFYRKYSYSQLYFSFNILFWSSDYYFLLNPYYYNHFFGSSISILTYKYFCRIYHDSFTIVCTRFFNPLNIIFWSSDFSVFVLFIYSLNLIFYHQNIKRQSFILSCILTW